MTKVIDNYGKLSQEEVAFIVADAESMDFEFVRYADEIEVTIQSHKPTKGEAWIPEFDVLIEGTSEDDERGEGYFFYSASKSWLKEKMEEEY